MSSTWPGIVSTSQSRISASSRPPPGRAARSPLSISRIVWNTRCSSTRSNANSSKPCLLDARTGRLAAVEGDIVAALRERASDAQLWQQVAGERPQREQDAAHLSASSCTGATPVAARRSSAADVAAEVQPLEQALGHVAAQRDHDRRPATDDVAHARLLGASAPAVIARATSSGRVGERSTILSAIASLAQNSPW